MDYLVAGAVPIVWHTLEDKYYDDQDKIAGPESFLGMVHGGMYYTGGLSAAIYTVLSRMQYIEPSIKNALIVGFVTYLPFFITSRGQYK